MLIDGTKTGKLRKVIHLLELINVTMQWSDITIEVTNGSLDNWLILNLKVFPDMSVNLRAEMHRNKAAYRTSKVDTYQIDIIPVNVIFWALFCEN